MVSGRVCIWVVSVLVLGLSGCASTQKTPGGGLRSVVAQNVVRIACVEAFRMADLTALSTRKTEIDLTGFVDDENRGILDLMARSRAEAAGAVLVEQGQGDLVMELAALNAGNDHGSSRIPLIRRAERSEGVVDLTLTIREAKSGQAISTQILKGAAKYEQRQTLGFETKARYYVRDEGGKFVRAAEPETYR